MIRPQPVRRRPCLRARLARAIAYALLAAANYAERNQE